MTAGFTAGEDKGLLVCAQICAALSFVGSSLLVLSFIRFSELRKLSFLLVALLAVADIGADITYFLGDPPNGSLRCYVQASFSHFFQIAGVFWGGVIAHSLYRTAASTGAPPPRPPHLLVWGAAFISMLLPFTTNSYGSTGPWCWISTTTNVEFDIGTAWRYLSFYIPLWLIICYTSYCYAVVYRTIKGAVRTGPGTSKKRALSLAQDKEAHAMNETPSEMNELEKRMLAFIEKLWIYPVILAVCWSLPTINRIQNSLQPQNPQFVLYLLATVSVRLQGAFNAVAYGLRNPKVRGAWSGRERIAEEEEEEGGIVSADVELPQPQQNLV